MKLFPYNIISISQHPLGSENLCLSVPWEGKLNLLLYLFPLQRCSISNSEPPKHNQLSELPWQRMRNADKTVQTGFFFSFFLFLMKREKTILFNALGEFFPVTLLKKNYSLHPVRIKSIICNKKLSRPFKFSESDLRLRFSGLFLKGVVVT